MDLEQLYKRIARARNDILMEEPCPMYEPQWENIYGTQDDRNIARKTSNSKRMSGDD
jgi:hypothetical protein